MPSSDSDSVFLYTLRPVAANDVTWLMLNKYIHTPGAIDATVKACIIYLPAHSSISIFYPSSSDQPLRHHPSSSSSLALPSHLHAEYYYHHHHQPPSPFPHPHPHLPPASSQHPPPSESATRHPTPPTASPVALARPKAAAPRPKTPRSYSRSRSSRSGRKHGSRPPCPSAARKRR